MGEQLRQLQAQVQLLTEPVAMSSSESEDPETTPMDREAQVNAGESCVQPTAARHQQISKTGNKSALPCIIFASKAQPQGPPRGKTVHRARQIRRDANEYL